MPKKEGSAKQPKHRAPENEFEDKGASFRPPGKGLSAKDTEDFYKAPDQQREETDGLTSNQNIGRTVNLSYSDDVGLNKHPEMLEKKSGTFATQLSPEGPGHKKEVPQNKKKERK